MQQLWIRWLTEVARLPLSRQLISSEASSVTLLSLDELRQSMLLVTAKQWAQCRKLRALAQLPFALETKTEEELVQLMAGAASALREAGCALVGGHTCEAKELGLGLAVNGY